MPKKAMAIGLLSCCLVYLYAHSLQAANPGTVVINELAWMGSELSANDEWLELFNPSPAEIDLTGWTLSSASGTPNISLAGTIPAGGYFLLERTDDQSAPQAKAQQIYSGALNNTGDDLSIKDKSGNAIDRISADQGWPAGDNSKKLTMSRDSNGFWRNSLEAGGTPGAMNSVFDPYAIPDTPTDGSVPANPGTTGTDPEAAETEAETAGNQANAKTSDPYRYGDVVINELVSDPSDGEEEWVELFSNLKEPADISGWWLEDGSGSKTALKGAIGISGTERFFIIDKPKGSLNNKGDAVFLKSASGRLMDKVVYGDWNDGNIAANASAAADPWSLARVKDGSNSYNSQTDFSLTGTITKKAANIISLPDEAAAAASPVMAKTGFDYAPDIAITEALPNPAGPDTENEFIELFNFGSSTINLSGWQIRNANGKKFTFPVSAGQGSGEYSLKAGGYLAVYRKESKLALSNSADTVKLFQPLAAEPLVSVAYEGVKEKMSYALAGSVSQPEYEWTDKPTPGAKNFLKVKNSPPEASFDCPAEAVPGTPVFFDSSDTTDAEGDALVFYWEFGDGATSSLSLPEHTFLSGGVFTVRLTVSDAEDRDEKVKILKISKSADTFRILSAASQGTGYSEGDVIINEFLPDPSGSDDGEWIEIYNQGGVRVNLLDWQVDDSEGGSKPFAFKDEFMLEAGKYFVLERKQSALALNNTTDSVRLFNPQKELVSESAYEKPKEGESYALGLNGKWFWSAQATKGKENVIKTPERLLPQVLGAKTVSSAKPKSAGSKNTVPFPVALSSVAQFEAGDLVTTSGTVAVLPGVFGTQYFYIVTGGQAVSGYSDGKEDEATSSPNSGEEPAVGLQVYNYKKDFPVLHVGDLVAVSGEVALSGDEKRLKTKDKAGIKVIGTGDAPRAYELPVDKINESYVGRFLMVSGEIVQRKSSLAILNDDTGELGIYVKRASGIAVSSLKEGDRLSVAGILVKASSGLQLLPRSSEDVIRIYEAKDGVSEVLGEVTVGSEWAIAERDSKIMLYKYMLIAGGGVILVLAVVLLRRRKMSD